MFKIKTPLEILEEIKQRRLKKNKEIVKQEVKEETNEKKINKKKSKRKRTV